MPDRIVSSVDCDTRYYILCSTISIVWSSIQKISIENDTAVSVSLHWPVLQFAVDRFAIYSRQVCNCTLQDMKVTFRTDDRAMHNILYCKLHMTVHLFTEYRESEYRESVRVGHWGSAVQWVSEHLFSANTYFQWTLIFGTVSLFIGAYLLFFILV